jgi:hypothetical protein
MGSASPLSTDRLIEALRELDRRIVRRPLFRDGSTISAELRKSIRLLHVRQAKVVFLRPVMTIVSS